MITEDTSRGSPKETPPGAEALSYEQLAAENRCLHAEIAALRQEAARLEKAQHELCITESVVGELPIMCAGASPPGQVFQNFVTNDTELLLVENNPEDQELTRDRLRRSKIVRGIEDFWLSVVRFPPKALKMASALTEEDRYLLLKVKGHLILYCRNYDADMGVGVPSSKSPRNEASAGSSQGINS